MRFQPRYRATQIDPCKHFLADKNLCTRAAEHPYDATWMLMTIGFVAIPEKSANTPRFSAENRFAKTSGSIKTMVSNSDSLIPSKWIRPLTTNMQIPVERYS